MLKVSWLLVYFIHRILRYSIDPIVFWFLRFDLNSFFKIEFSFIGITWLFNEHVIIETFVVVIVESHNSTHEGLHYFLRLLKLVLRSHCDWNHYWLLNEVSCPNQCIGTGFLQFADWLDSLNIIIHVTHGLKVWVVQAVLNWMANLFATKTSHIAQLFFFLLCAILWVIWITFLLFRLVFTELATRLVDATFATAPPNFTAPVGLMRSTWPIEVLFFRVLLGTIFTNLAQVFAPAFTKFKSNHLKF